MNIGIDIDGTLTKYPEFFSILTSLWTAGDWPINNVYIITGLGQEAAEEKLANMPFNFSYNKLITTALYNDEEKALIGKVESNEEIVGRFKQRMCRELDVKIMFDDQASIHRQFGDVPIFEVK